jgi:hypothetical protein
MVKSIFLKKSTRTIKCYSLYATEALRIWYKPINYICSCRYKDSSFDMILLGIFGIKDPVRPGYLLRGFMPKAGFEW